jgi:hypothetical protein
VWRFFQRHKITFKKKPERGRAAARRRGAGAATLMREQGMFDAALLVFIDETRIGVFSRQAATGEQPRRARSRGSLGGEYVSVLWTKSDLRETARLAGLIFWSALFNALVSRAVHLLVSNLLRARRSGSQNDAIADQVPSQPANRLFDRAGAVARSWPQISELDKLCDHRKRRNRPLETDKTATR